MKLTIHTKNYTVSDRLRGILEKKLEKIDKYFNDASCTIVCTRVGITEKMEVTITSGGHAFRAQEENRSMYSNIDIVLAKIERQIVKNKEKLEKVVRREAIDKRDFAFISRKQTFVTAEVVKNKTFDIKLLTDEQAELGLGTLDHNFFIYGDPKTKGVKVMYRRDDGNVGVIEIANASIVKK